MPPTDETRTFAQEQVAPGTRVTLPRGYNAVQLRAAASPADGPDRIGLATAPVRIEAARGEGKRPTFDIVGYTGVPMNVSGFFNPVIVDLAGLKAPSQTIPALRNHDDDRIVGQTDSIKIGQDVQLTGVITGDNADAQEVVSQSRNGFKWQASIGATILRREFLDVGNRATVNGREVSGPLVIARESQLYEISFVALGADSQTSAEVAASQSLGNPKGDHQMNFDEWLKAKGYDPAAISDTLRAALRAAFDADPARNGTAPPPAQTPPAQSQQAQASQQQQQQQPTPPAGPVHTTQTIDQIVAAQRAEDERVRQITAIAEQAIRRRPMLLDDFELMAKAAIANRQTTVADFELQVLRREREAPAGAGFSVHAGHAGRPMGPRVVEAALCRTLGLRSIDKQYDAQTLEAADQRYRHGVSLQELLLMAARENGFGGMSVRGDLEGVLRAAFPRRRDDVRAEGFSTISLPGILSNVANKFLMQAFNAVESAWREIARIRPLNDFKAMTIYSLTGDLTYEKVGPAGEIKHGTLGETTYSLQASTYAKMLAITRAMIINDDLGALEEVPSKLGRGAALKLNAIFWATFLAGVGTFWASGNGNLITGAGTVLQASSLDTANSTFMKQTDPDGFPLGVMPKVLLVPPELSVTAAALMSSTLINTGGSSTTTIVPNANPWQSKFRPVTSAYLSNSAITGYSTTAWFLLADPNDLPTIAVGFLNGRDTPLVESADAEFDTLGIQFRGVHDFGCSLLEPRGSLRSAGA